MNRSTHIPPHILIVDDDLEIRTLLAEYLSANGYQASTAMDGDGLNDAMATANIDLIVLDLNLPGEDGLSLCRKLRAQPAQANLPVIMLTARGEPLDRILGLEMGADDYLAKPFEPRELLARIRSVLRRSQAMPGFPNEGMESSWHFSGWRLDPQSPYLVNPAGTLIMLSGAEMRLLKVFLNHPNRVLTREQLLDLTQDGQLEPFDRSIDILVSRLRQKLNDEARAPQIIKTVRNGGYMFAAPVNQGQPA